MAVMHEIDYKIFGDDMQYVEVELDPNEATVAEAGGMMYMDDGVEMETIFGLTGETGQVRVFGEAVDVLCREGKAAAALRIEELGNTLALKHGCSILCAYSLSVIYEKAGPDTLARVCQLHGDVQLQ